MDGSIINLGISQDPSAFCGLLLKFCRAIFHELAKEVNLFIFSDYMDNLDFREEIIY